MWLSTYWLSIPTVSKLLTIAKIHNKREKRIEINVCSESHAWNVNYVMPDFQMNYSIQALPNKYIGRYGDYWHSKQVTLHIYSNHGIGVFNILFSLFLRTLAIDYFISQGI